MPKGFFLARRKPCVFRLYGQNGLFPFAGFCCFSYFKPRLPHIHPKSQGSLASGRGKSRCSDVTFVGGWLFVVDLTELLHPACILLNYFIFSRSCCGPSLVAINAIIGGIVSQEIIQVNDIRLHNHFVNEIVGINHAVHFSSSISWATWHFWFLGFVSQGWTERQLVLRGREVLWGDGFMAPKTPLAVLYLS